jgi:hypothetical protein
MKVRCKPPSLYRALALLVAALILSIPSPGQGYSPGAGLESLSAPEPLYILSLNPDGALQTRVDLTNTQDSEISVTVTAYDRFGAVLGAVWDAAPLGARSTKIIDVSDVPQHFDFLKIEPTGRVLAVATFKTTGGKKSEAVTAVEPSKNMDFPSLERGDAPFKVLLLLNPGAASSSLKLTALDRDGREIGRATLGDLAPMEVKRLALTEVFDEGTLSELATVRAVSNGNLAGFQFSGLQNGDFVGLPAHSLVSKGWSFFTPDRKGSLKLWAKVGMFNPGSERAHVDLEAFDAAEGSLGLIERVVLDPGAVHFLKTANKGGKIPPGTASVKASSDQPVKGYETIGAMNAAGVAATLGLPEEDLVVQGVEITGKEDGSALNLYPALSKRNGAADPTSLDAGSITVSVPNGGESWQASTRHTISWSSSGDAGSYVSIDLYKAGGWYGTIASGLWIGSGSFSWLIPYNLAPASEYKVRVRSDIGIEDFSNANFTVTPPTITVVTPNGGETWQASTTRTIAWTFTANPGTQVNIDLYKAAGWVRNIASGLPIGSAGKGSFKWLIPYGQTPGKDYTIRVRSNRGFEDFSNANFTITPPTMSITAPNGGESWQAGTLHTIAWTFTANPGTVVSIELYKAGGWIRTIANGLPIGTAGKGSLAWRVPSDLTPANDYKVRVHSDRGFEVFSAQNFTITATGITVKAPSVAGIQWQMGTAHTIQWTFKLYSGEYVNIDLYKAGGWIRTIATGLLIGSDGTGSFSWLIPSDLTPAGDYKIRVRSDWGFEDFSDNNFTLTPTGVTVVSPNGGQTWAVNTLQTIKWTFKPYSGEYVSIDLYKAGGWVRGIAGGLLIGDAGQGSFSWLVPANLTPAGDYKIRVRSDWGFEDYSDGNFAISGP